MLTSKTQERGSAPTQPSNSGAATGSSERASIVDRNRSQTDAIVRAHEVESASDGASRTDRVAAQGTEGASSRLPHLDQIQAAFGRHDVGGVQAHVGGPAASATKQLGAEGYARGNHVAFGQTPDLHTAAHEAAHVVQQRGGVQLKAGVGQAGDEHERHADAVADAVVAGRSAEALLDQKAAAGGDQPVVQHKLSWTAGKVEQAMGPGGTFEPERNVVAELRRYASTSEAPVEVQRHALEQVLLWCDVYLREDRTQSEVVRRPLIQQVRDDVDRELRQIAWQKLKEDPRILYRKDKPLTAQEALDRLTRVVRGESKALDGLEHPPDQYEGQSQGVANLMGEWGVAERDGEAYIVNGDGGGVQWRDILAAGGNALAHSHPYPIKTNDYEPRAIDSKPDAVIPFADLIDGKVQNAQLMVLPSNSDVVFSARHHVPRHTVVTPYVGVYQRKQGQWYVSNPRSALIKHLAQQGHTAIPIHFEILQAKDVDGGDTTFSCTMVARTSDGQEIWRKDGVIASANAMTMPPQVT